jgi:hypothetical protein
MEKSHSNPSFFGGHNDVDIISDNEQSFKNEALEQDE